MERTHIAPSAAQHKRLIPAQVGILLVFALAPFWLKLPDAPPPFSTDYVLGFVIVIPMALTVIAWLLAGAPNWRALFRSHTTILLAGALLALVIWTTASQAWAFVGETRPGVAQNDALQLAITAAFTLVVICAAPSPRVIVLVLAASTVFHGVIGALQVAAQGAVGMEMLGENSLDPARSGVSVIQAGALRWLRPYGLLPHPNIFAGFMAVGTFAAAALALTSRSGRFLSLIGLASYGFGLWMLMLTFSRGAWVGFAGAVLLVLPLLLRHQGIRRRLAVLVGISVLLGIAFVLLYQPLILTRTGQGQENTEMRSLSDRVVFTDIALDAIQRYPLHGVGGDNFPWYASDYLFYRTDYDLRGDNVHNVALLVTAELGVIGLGLLALILISGVRAAVRRIRHTAQPLMRIALLAGFLALMVIGLFDHYPWTLVMVQPCWLGLLAATAAPGPD